MGIRNRTGPSVDPAAGAGTDQKNTRRAGLQPIAASQMTKGPLS